MKLKCECGRCHLCKMRNKYRLKAKNPELRKAAQGQQSYPEASCSSRTRVDNPETILTPEILESLERVKAIECRQALTKNVTRIRGTFPEFLELIDHTMLNLALNVTREGKTIVVSISPPARSPEPGYERMSIKSI